MSLDKKAARYISPASAGAMLFGAVVGGVAAAAANARKVKRGEMSARTAAVSVLREAGTTGLASGAGVAAVTALHLGGVAGLVGIAAVATGAKYFMDSVLDGVLAKGGLRNAALARKAPAGADVAEPVCGAASSVARIKPAVKPKAPKKPAAKAAAKAAKSKSQPETFITE